MNPTSYINSLIKDGIDKSKMEAITTTDGPLLIIAGPGSGKTKTLVERILFLIQVKKVAPENILVATFTDKAAKELITRVSNRLLELNIKVNLNEMYIGTLHSIFLRFLEDNREFTRLKKNYAFLDQFDQAYLVYSNFDKFSDIEDIELVAGEKNTSMWDRSHELIKQLNKISEEYLDVSKLKKSKHPEVRALGKAYEAYIELLHGENSLDFSSIQVEALELLAKHPKVLKDLQDKIQYLMIDEYQDTNTIQEMILLKLAGKHNNICVVGDDDQGLYRFRGATIRNILEFPDNFKKNQCKKVKLTTNYRSHPGIIDFYNRWMQEIDWKEGRKQFRFDKIVEPRKEKFTKNPSVIKVSSDKSEEDYQKEVLSFIRTLEKEKILDDHNQIAFLFRSVKNDGVLHLAHYLENNGINVFSPRSALFFERREITLAIGCLIFIFPRLFEWLKWNDKAELGIWQFYENCKREFANELRVNKNANKDLIKWCQKKAQEHVDILNNKDYAFAALLYEMLQFPVFANPLDVDLLQKKHDLRPAYNLALLSQLFTKYEALVNITVFTKDNHLWVIRKFFNQYLRFLYDGGIGEFEDFDEYAPSGSVSFMTIHQSKGLEFPIVFVGSLNAVPRRQITELDIILQSEYYHKKPFEPYDRLKEFDFWRLFYTAFSRPQNLLVLTGFEKEGRWAMPSKYFKKLYDQVPGWRGKRFKIKDLKLEAVKEINIKHEYSFTSHITVYETCPLQYKFYKDIQFSPVRNAATMFGQLVHQTIEDVHKTVLRNEVEKVTDDNIKFWFESNYSTLSKSLKSYLAEAQKNAALRHVMEYKKRHEDKWDIIKQAEVDVSLVKDDYILTGKIDLIRGKDDTVEVVDFKGEKKPDIHNPEIQQKLKRYQRQLEVYAHLVEERTGEKVSKMHLYYTGEVSGNPHVTFDYKKEKIDNTIKEFDIIVGKIEEKDFDMSDTKKTDQLCGNCDMRFYCNLRKK